MSTKLDRLHDDLQVDGAITLKQLKRRYYISRTEANASGFHLFDRPVPLTGRSRRPIKVSFVATNQSVTTLSGNTLRHLSGIAEIRHELRAPVSAWQRPLSRYTGELPDAIYQSSTGAAAVEFDAGTYSRVQVIKKLNAFAGSEFSAQIWGTPSQARSQFIQTLALKRELPLSLYVTHWA